MKTYRHNYTTYSHFCAIIRKAYGGKASRVLASYARELSRDGYLWDSVYIGRHKVTIYKELSSWRGYLVIQKSRNCSLAKCERAVGIHFTVDHTGKMRGNKSLSTSSKLNPYCRARCKVAGCICEQCYATTMSNNYSALDQCLRRNTEILTESLIPDEYIPYIDNDIFRFEAFGDIITEIQVANYFAIARANPLVACALWTKNPHIIADAIATGYKKPANLVIIYSSPMIDKCAGESLFERYPFIDKIFTVYSEDGAHINCGARNCKKCRRCYCGTDRYVNELLRIQH